MLLIPSRRAASFCVKRLLSAEATLGSTSTETTWGLVGGRTGSGKRTLDDAGSSRYRFKASAMFRANSAGVLPCVTHPFSSMHSAQAGRPGIQQHVHHRGGHCRAQRLVRTYPIPPCPTSDNTRTATAPMSRSSTGAVGAPRQGQRTMFPNLICGPQRTT